MFIKARRINRSTAHPTGGERDRERGLLSRNFNGDSIVAALPLSFSLLPTCLVIKIISHNVRKRRQQITTKSARPKSRHRHRRRRLRRTLPGAQ